MKHIHLELTIGGFNEQNVLMIQEFLEPYEEAYFEKFIQKYPESELQKIHLHLCDDIWTCIDEFYSAHGFVNDKSRPKGLDHLVKAVTLNGETKFFWNAKYLSKPAVPLVFRVVFEHLIGIQMYQLYRVNLKIDFEHGLEYLCDSLFHSLTVHTAIKDATSEIVGKESLDYESMEEFTFAFKRNIKLLHLAYQANKDYYNFLVKAITELDLYLSRILSFRNERNLKKLDEFAEEVASIVRLVDSSINELGKPYEINLAKARLNIVTLLKKCDIELFEANDSKNIGFKISEGPKKLFQELIDTHPRIVCYLDILGFKALIEEYESENTSLALKHLKTAFDDAMNASLTILPNTLEDEVREHLEFRMFSDCIIISIPYIEFGIDIKKGFSYMALIINVMQQTFMKSGFYLRGHVTMGSYYSDKNMLFSGGLVEAYKNEAATVYPVVSINEKILRSLEKPTEYDHVLLSYEKLIIRHNFHVSKTNTFINPLYTIDSYKNIDSQFNSTLTDILGGQQSFAPFNLSFTSLLNEALKNQGMPNFNIEHELEKAKQDIRDELMVNYRKQLEIYRDLNNSPNDRALASGIIEKYKFLIDLFSWLEDGNASDKFEYVGY